jgi:hypothetical protein
MSIVARNVKGFLRNFRTWEKGEKDSCVPTAERRNLRSLFPVVLRRDQSHHLRAVPLEVLRDSPEGDESPVVHRRRLQNPFMVKRLKRNQVISIIM